MLKPEKCIKCKQVKCNCSNIDNSQNLKPCCPENEIVSISIVEDKVMVTLDDCTYYLADLDVLKFNTNDDYVVSGSVIPKTDTEPELIRLVRKLGEKVDIDVSSITGSTVTGGDLINNILTIHQTNGGDDIDIDLSSLNTKDTYISNHYFTEDNKLILVRNDKKELDGIDLSKYVSKNTYVISGSVNNENNLELLRNDNKTVTIDMSAFAPKDDYVMEGRVNSEYKLELDRKLGGKIVIDTSIFKSNDASPYIISGTFQEGDDNNYFIEFVRNDDSTIIVDMTDIINNLKETIFEKVMQTGFTLNTQNEDYTTQEIDFNGRTIIRANKNADQIITITKPPKEDFIGKVLYISKTNGDVDTFTNLAKGEGVTLIPEDITPIRRIGNAVRLLYIGDGVYDVGGELP